MTFSSLAAVGVRMIFEWSLPLWGEVTLGVVRQIDNVPNLLWGPGGLGIWGGQVVVDVFPEGIAEFCHQRGV